jgi:hypothetical protein
MKKLSVMIVLAAMLLAGEAGAGTIQVWGAGTVSCGTWATERRRDSFLSIDEFTWVQGYVTGLNSGLPSTDSNYGQVGVQLDPDAAKVWLDNYCQAHPLESLARAADSLYDYAKAQNK